MLDAEALAITKSLAEGVKTYDQVVEVSDVLQTCFSLQNHNFWLRPSVAPGIAASWRRSVVPRVFTVS